MLHKNYDYFLKIVEYRSISQAAEHLYVSQPSLTKYLQRLENSVGATLFDRSQSPLKLTLAGEYFLEHVLQMQKEEKWLNTRIDEIQNQGRDQITIGMPLWRSAVLLPEFLPGFYKRHPLIQIKLVEGSASLLEESIRTDKIDFGIMNLPVNYADVSYEAMAEENIFLVGSNNMPAVQEILRRHHGEGYPHADINALRAQPFILTQAGQHLTDFINEMLSRHNLNLNCIFRTRNVATAVNLAAAGLGFTFVPALGTQSRDFPADRTALFTIDDPILRCTLAAVYKKNKYQSAAMKLFLSEFHEFCEEFQRF